MNYKNKDLWDKFHIISQIIAYVAIPIVIFWMGNNINSTIQDREIRVKYLEIAMDILKSEPNKETVALRDWAITIIEKYSEIELSSEVLQALMTKPISGSFLVDEKGNYLTDSEGNRLVTK